MPSNRYHLSFSIVLAALLMLPQIALAQRLADVTGSIASSPAVVLDHGPQVLRSGGGIVLTHNESQEIVAATGIACSAAGETTENSYFRVFDLSEFDTVTDAFSVTSVDIGIETTTIMFDAPISNVRLYTLDGTFTVANLTEVSDTEFEVLDDYEAEVVTVELDAPADFAADDVIVVEWNVPNLQDEASGVFFGGNTDGQTGPTYVLAADCGLAEPTDLAALNFPDVAWVLNVNGTTVGTNAEGAAVAQRVTLGQAYPNPAVGRTAIPFVLQTAQRVRIAIYDALGREVTVAADRTFGAGEQIVEASMAGLPSGLYFYRINAGEQTLTRKLVVLQ